MNRLLLLTLLLPALVACTGDSTASSSNGLAGGSGGSTSTGSAAGGNLGSGGAGACSVSSEVDCRYRSTAAVQGAVLTRRSELDSLVPGGALPIPKRKVPILVRWSSKATGKLPIVLWSHGGSWNPEGEKLNTTWSTALVEAGYAVIHMAHAPLPDPRSLGLVCEAVGLDKTSNECDDFSLYENFWINKSCSNDSECLSECDWAKQGCACLGSASNPSKKKCGPPPSVTENPFASLLVMRATDTALVLDNLDSIAKQLGADPSDPVELDTSKVAVAGWSGGSQNPMVTAGAVYDLSKTLNRFEASLKKPVAFLAISPQGPGYSNYFATMSETSWDKIDRPMMVLTGFRDMKAANEMTGEDRRKAYENLPAGDKFMLYSKREDEAIEHGTFNLGGFDPSKRSKLDPLYWGLQSAAVAFLDAYVRNDKVAQSYLASQDPAKIDPGQTEWLQK
jgi:hypothetical protein